MNLDVLHLRRPKIEYVSPPVCEGSFSGSGSTIIVLDPFTRDRITGVIIGDDGNGNLIVSWPDFPGAVCYNVYEQQPDGSLVLIAECVECCDFPLPPDIDGPIVVTPIDDDGEGDPSDPVLPPDGPPGGGCTEFIDQLTLSVSSTAGTDELSHETGLVAGTYTNLCGMYFNRVEGPVRTTRSSGTIQASQSASDLVNTDGTDFFLPGDVGKFLFFTSGGDAREILMVNGPTQVQVDVSDTVALSTFAVRGSTIGGIQGVMYGAGDGNHMFGQEALPDGSTMAMVWYDHTTGIMRAVGIGFDYLPQDITVDGFLLYSFNNGSTIETFIYNPNTEASTNCGVFTPWSLNDSLTVVGWRLIEDPTFVLPNETRAIKWQAGVITDLQPADGLAAADGPDSQAIFVNNAGLIIGDYTQDVGGGIQQQRVFYNNGAGSFSIGHFFVGPDPSIGEMNVAALSQTGIACGTGGIDAVENFRGWRWSIANGLEQLAAIPGKDNSGANDVNDAGYAVGISHTTSDPNGAIAVIWFPGETTARPIIDFLPEGHGWTSLTNAHGISNDNEIIGAGIKDGDFHNFFCKLCLDA